MPTPSTTAAEQSATSLATTGGSAESAYAIYNSGVIGDITGDVTAGMRQCLRHLQQRRNNRRHHRRSDSRRRRGAFAVYNGGGGTIGDITGDVTAGMRIMPARLQRRRNHHRRSDSRKHQ